MTPAPPRRGRHPGTTDTRETILTAARKTFADKGYNRAGIRAIAEDAAVDPALIYHYFGGKKGLFLAAMNITLDPEAVTRAILDGPRTEVGFRLVRYVLGFWGPRREAPRWRSCVPAWTTTGPSASWASSWPPRSFAA